MGAVGNSTSGGGGSKLGDAIGERGTRAIGESVVAAGVRRGSSVPTTLVHAMQKSRGTRTRDERPADTTKGHRSSGEECDENRRPRAHGSLLNIGGPNGIFL